MTKFFLNPREASLYVIPTHRSHLTLLGLLFLLSWGCQWGDPAAHCSSPWQASGPRTFVCFLSPRSV